MKPIYNASQLLLICNAPNTQDNNCIAQTIINIYIRSINFYQENMIECMREFITSNSLNFAKYNIKF